HPERLLAAAVNATTIPRPVGEAVDATLEGAASEAVAALIHGGVNHLVHEVRASVAGEAVSEEGVAVVLCLHLGGDGRVHRLVVGGFGEWTL
ncbi:hypothetical protein B296_00022795, partial [Ensete ventricosum]